MVVVGAVVVVVVEVDVVVAGAIVVVAERGSIVETGVFAETSIAGEVVGEVPPAQPANVEATRIRRAHWRTERHVAHMPGRGSLKILMRDKVTAPKIRDRKGGPKITMITAYDYPGAMVADQAGVDIVLIGDSVANVVHGMETTLEIGLDEIVLHTRAVKRANPRALVVADMPWLTFHLSEEDAIRNAGRLVREGGAEAVKLEGGRKRLNMVEAILDAEIPVMGHVGLTPQSVHAMGGFKVQGRMVDAAKEMIADAKALSDAGCFSIVIEGVPDVLGEIITKEVDAPTIGIGAGPHTDGQVLVFHDLLGLGSGDYPKFVRSYGNLAEQAVEAISRFKSDVESGVFPADEESYHVPDEVASELLKGTKSD